MYICTDMNDTRADLQDERDDDLPIRRVFVLEVGVIPSMRGKGTREKIRHRDREYKHASKRPRAQGKSRPGEKLSSIRRIRHIIKESSTRDLVRRLIRAGRSFRASFRSKVSLDSLGVEDKEESSVVDDETEDKARVLQPRIRGEMRGELRNKDGMEVAMK